MFVVPQGTKQSNPQTQPLQKKTPEQNT